MYRSIERSAQHEAQRTEQKAKLERQKLQNEKVKSVDVMNTYVTRHVLYI